MNTSQRFVFPVVHHRDDEQAAQQALLALNLGADGVFLISHRCNDAALIETFQLIRAVKSDACIGVNFLSRPAPMAIAAALAAGVDIVWTDNPGVSSNPLTGNEPDVSGLSQFFGSVAFKYQPHERDPGLAAIHALQVGMIPTTSGDATGHQPSVDKIRKIREVIGPDAPLAIASGMTPENVRDYLPYATHFLVATGVSTVDDEFDPARLKQFIDTTRAFSPIEDQPC